MSNGTYGYTAIRLALRGKWEEINYGVLKETIHNYRDGTDSKPGSENYGTLAYLAALMIWWLNPRHLSRVGLTEAGLRNWWRRELEVRLERGLQLLEARSRIYCIFSQAPICWLYGAFVALGLATLHRRYVTATAAQVALVAFPVRPERLSPQADDNPWPNPISVPLVGARSLEVNEHHHMLHCAYEMFAAGLLEMNWSRGGGSQTAWAREVIDLARPGWMGMSVGEIDTFRRAIRRPTPDLAEELVSWLHGVGTRWACRLVRFERGAACIGIDRTINGNTAPIAAMAIHEDGTLHWLGTHTRSHRVDGEPCGVETFNHSDGSVSYFAWAGGEDWPRVELELIPARWGKPVWDVLLNRNGEHEILLPRRSEPAPPPPEPPEEPSEEERRCDDWPGVLRWLCRLFVRLTD